MAEQPAALDRGMARGVAAYRGLALAWAWVGVVLEREHLDHAGVAISALAAATAFTVWLTAEAGRDGNALAAPAVMGLEIAAGVALLLLDGVVYDAMREQSLPWAWPAAGILAVAVARGVRWGLATSALMAAASFVGESILRDNPQWTTSAASKSALFVLAAVAAGAVADRLRDAEAEISLARSREETARVLHDGVLQTLAVIMRRSTDDDLRTLATEQERDLRSYLAAGRRQAVPLSAGLAAIVETISERHDLAVELVVADDVPTIGEKTTRALVGAAGEALTNAAKHAAASRVVVFVEPGDDHAVFCAIRDDGVGFDAEDTHEGSGLRHSISERIEEIGGRVEIDTKPGRGTEVRLWAS